MNRLKIKRKPLLLRTKRRPNRRGAAVLDYVLVLGVILPLATFVMVVCPRIMNLVYEMLSLFVSWPFM